MSRLWCRGVSLMRSITNFNGSTERQLDMMAVAMVSRGRLTMMHQHMSLLVLGLLLLLLNQDMRISQAFTTEYYHINRHPRGSTFYPIENARTSLSTSNHDFNKYLEPLSRRQRDTEDLQDPVSSTRTRQKQTNGVRHTIRRFLRQGLYRDDGSGDGGESSISSEREAVLIDPHPPSIPPPLSVVEDRPAKKAKRSKGSGAAKKRSTVKSTSAKGSAKSRRKASSSLSSPPFFVSTHILSLPTTKGSTKAKNTRSPKKGTAKRAVAIPEPKPIVKNVSPSTIGGAVMTAVGALWTIVFGTAFGHHGAGHGVDLSSLLSLTGVTMAGTSYMAVQPGPVGEFVRDLGNATGATVFDMMKTTSDVVVESGLLREADKNSPKLLQGLSGLLKAAASALGELLNWTSKSATRSLGDLLDKQVTWTRAEKRKRYERFQRRMLNARLRAERKGAINKRSTSSVSESASMREMRTKQLMKQFVTADRTAAALREAARIAKQKQLAEEARAKELRLAEESRRRAEAARKKIEEERRQAEIAAAAKKREEAAERARKAEERRKAAEEQRIAERAEMEARLLAEANRRAEAIRLEREAAIQRREEAARRAEEERIAKEARAAADAAKRAERQARVAEQKRREEQARRAEEARLAEERRLAEIARAQEEARRAKAEATRRKEEARVAELARVEEEARLFEENLRLAEEARRAVEISQQSGVDAGDWEESVRVATRSIEGKIAAWDDDDILFDDIERDEWEAASRLARELGDPMDDTPTSDNSETDLDALAAATRAAVVAFEQQNWADDIDGEETDWSKLKVSELRDELRKRGLPVPARKNDMIVALKSFSAKQIGISDTVPNLKLWEGTPTEAREFDDSGLEMDGPVVESVDWSGMSMKDLRAELKSRGLSTGGKKEVLVARLREYDNSSFRLLDLGSQASGVDDIVAALDEFGDEPSDEALLRLEDELQELLSPQSSSGGEDVPEAIDYYDWNIAQLKDKLRSLGLPVGGKKSVLVERLRNAQ
jgi:SAP domain